MEITKITSVELKHEVLKKTLLLITIKYIIKKYGEQRNITAIN